MKKIKLKAEDLGAHGILTKEELKSTVFNRSASKAAGCSASVQCPGEGEVTCSCTNQHGTCSSTATSVDCECGNGLGLTYTCPENGSGSGSGSGRGSGSGSGRGSGSGSGGGSGSGPGGGSGSGSGSGSAGPFQVTVENQINATISIWIDGVEYMSSFGTSVLPVTLSQGNHIFHFPCMSGIHFMSYLINGSPAVCGIQGSRYVDSDITITIQSA